MTANDPAAPLSPVPAALLTLLQRRLRARAAELQAEVDEHRGHLVEPAAQTSNAFIAGSEGAVADADDERELTLWQRALRELAEVRQALARIDAGSYGRCTRCGDAIALARLDARPEAALCLPCQARAEGARRA